jgi:hypothetical protein
MIFFVSLALRIQTREHHLSLKFLSLVKLRNNSLAVHIRDEA